MNTFDDVPTSDDAGVEQFCELLASCFSLQKTLALLVLGLFMLGSLTGIMKLCMVHETQDSLKVLTVRLRIGIRYESAACFKDRSLGDALDHLAIRTLLHQTRRAKQWTQYSRNTQQHSQNERKLMHKTDTLQTREAFEFQRAR